MIRFINTVLGAINESEVKACLCHEHICCFSEYLFKMAGKAYLDMEKLASKSISELKRIKDTYGMNLFVDCTPINIGRNIDLLKKISKESGVHIVCSTGFYYTDEPVLYNMSEEKLAECIVTDAKETNAGIIKAAVENETISSFNEKLLKVTALAQQKLGLPVVLHTNANNKNGLAAVKILLKNGVRPECITVGHLSDTEDIDYITEIANYGCFIGLDRLYNDTSEDYINKKLRVIQKLCEQGFKNRIILSHDEQCFNGFEVAPQIKKTTRFDYVFKYILPKLQEELADEIICGTSETVRIGKSEFPREVVRSRLFKLNCEHIEYVVDCMKENTTDVRNIRSYLLTALYNAPATIDNHYRAKVNHDLYGN